jgi:hypothetical protein
VKTKSIGKQINVFWPDGKFMTKHPSISEAARVHAVHHANIRAYLAHGKSPDGCMWKYAEART